MVPQFANQCQVEHIASTFVLTFSFSETVDGKPGLSTVVARVGIPKELAAVLITGLGKQPPPISGLPGQSR